MPVASERTRIEPGEYPATCTAVNPPTKYREFQRWYMRFDFTVHSTGEIVPKYINLGNGPEPNLQLSHRSDYYKLWTLAMGRSPEKGEPMDPTKIIGKALWVTVEDRNHQSDGQSYSRIQTLRRETGDSEALNSVLNHSVLNSSETQELNHSGFSSTQ